VLGAIAGDIIGSVHEYSGTKTCDFELFAPGCQFTDDTVLAVAVADCLLNQSDYVQALHEYSKAYPGAGYGLRFSKWIAEGDRNPYNSWGNGSAMRVAPVGHAFPTLSEVQDEARRSAEVTHNHPEGIRGAQATATAIFLARHGYSKDQIRSFIENSFGYDLGQRLDDIRPTYSFDESCQRTVPQALIAFLESSDYEDAIRKAISLGGDADTLACICGGVAEAFYGGVPPAIAQRALTLLDGRLRSVTLMFCERYGVPMLEIES
jgi:ADP-ribosylglycohydrolase